MPDPQWLTDNKKYVTHRGAPENETPYEKNVLDALAQAHAHLDELTEVCNDSNAVCVCGCPASEHEMVGPEEGEQCEHEDHQCIRTSPAVAKMVADLHAAAKGLHSIVDEKMGDSDDETGEDRLAEALARVAALVPGPW